MAVYAKTRSQPHVAAALRGSIMAARKSPTAPVREQRSGRLDRGRLSRLASGDHRVFVQRAAPAPSRIRVAILLDASGSMNDGRINVQTAQMARDLADATALLPNVTASIWAHTTKASQGDLAVVVHRLWDTGEPMTGIDAYQRISMSGNTDGVAIQYVGETLLAEAQSSEATLLLVVSDGEPAYMVPPTPEQEDEGNRLQRVWQADYSKFAADRAALIDKGIRPPDVDVYARPAYKALLAWHQANGGDERGAVEHMRTVVNGLRKRHMAVVSVAVRGGISATQRNAFGVESVVEYNADYRVTARSMAKAIGGQM